jgi:hypothetical protein
MPPALPAKGASAIVKDATWKWGCKLRLGHPLTRPASCDAGPRSQIRSAAEAREGGGAAGEQQAISLTGSTRCVDRARVAMIEVPQTNERLGPAT